jgi:LPXTG-motif cell wall-anchored protein
MRNSFKGFLAATVIIAPMMANASTLIGEWTGTGQPVPADGTSEVVDLNFLTETPDGSAFDVTGTVDIICLNSSDPKCGSHGNLSLTGSLAANGSLTTTLSGYVDGNFDGSVSGNQNSLTGVLMSPSNGFQADWTLSKVSPNAAPEMNPASAASGLALLVGGLLVLRGRKRQVVG